MKKWMMIKNRFKLFTHFVYYIYINYTIWGCHRIDSQIMSNYAGIGSLNTRLINNLANALNGNYNELGTSEDLVACLENNMLTVRELEVA